VRSENINERNNFDLIIIIYTNNKVKKIDGKQTKLNRNNEFETKDIIFKKRVKK